MNPTMTHLPLAFSEILFDLSADRLVDVLVQGGVSSNPDTERRQGTFHWQNGPLHSVLLYRQKSF